MEHRTLGTSGLQVSLVGLGCNNFGGRCDEEATRAVVHRALDEGNQNTRQQHYGIHYYSYPGYRSYSSPSQHYYNKGYTQPYLDSRFPNSYRNYSYYQQQTPRYNGNNINYSVNAWESLAQGDARRALSQFWLEAQSYPKAGLPKIGYSLSAAASGDLKQGVVAMRRAFKIDPDTLRHYQLDPRLQPLVTWGSSRCGGCCWWRRKPRCNGS